MRALKEVLIDFVPHEAIESVTYALCLRVLQALLWLDLEVLLSVSRFVLYTPIHRTSSICGLFRRANVTFVSLCSITVIGTAAKFIAICKFVRVDEVALVLVLSVCFNELVRLRPTYRLIVGRVAALLHRRSQVTAAYGRCVLTDHIVLYLVLIMDAQLVLVAAAWLNVCSLLPRLGHERLLSECDTFIIATLIADGVSGAFVELVVIAELLNVLRVHRSVPRIVVVRV